MRSLVLSLFPGAGVLDGAFEREGYCVVRGPDLLIGSDIHDFHVPSGKFDGVIGGIPATLVHEFDRIIGEADPAWWVAEVGQGSPFPSGWESEQMIGSRRFLWKGLSVCRPVLKMGRAATDKASAEFAASLTRSKEIQ